MPPASLQDHATVSLSQGEGNVARNCRDTQNLDVIGKCASKRDGNRIIAPVSQSRMIFRTSTLHG